MSDNKYNQQSLSDTKEPQENKEDYTFIKETIRPKKKTKLKKLGFTIALAAAFGIVASFTFCAFYPAFSQMFHREEDQSESDNNKTENPATLSPTPKKTPTPTLEPTMEPTALPGSDKDRDETYASFLFNIRKVQGAAYRSIVTVNGIKTGKDILDNPDEESNYASGIVIDKDDSRILILTSSDVVEGATTIVVSLSSAANYTGNVYGVNKQIGVAVISLSTKEIEKRLLDNLIVVEMGDSALLKLGDPVVAMGNPNGFMNSIDYGVVANALHDAYITDAKIQLLNTTMSKNPNGYGFVFDANGRMVGIITHKENLLTDYNANLNTCLSISSIRPMLQRMIAKEQTRYLGIFGNEITVAAGEKLGVSKGIYITRVEEDSPAFTAGVKKGDVLVQINDISIKSMNYYSNTLSALEKGSQVELHLKRKQEGEWETVIVMATVGLAE